jgi:hypothetical protein
MTVKSLIVQAPNLKDKVESQYNGLNSSRLSTFKILGGQTHIGIIVKNFVSGFTNIYVHSNKKGFIRFDTWVQPLGGRFVS